MLMLYPIFRTNFPTPFINPILISHLQSLISFSSFTYLSTGIYDFFTPSFQSQDYLFLTFFQPQTVMVTTRGASWPCTNRFLPRDAL